MKTAKNVYNIIWVDDEIDTLLDENTYLVIETLGFNLLDKARTFTDFVEIMKVHAAKVDAVITDANFNSNSTIIKDERDLSGFVKIRDYIFSINSKFDIPFYLYTGKAGFLDDKYTDGELDYFKDRYFTKGDFGEMLEKIRIEVDNIKSPSFQIRRKYKRELEAARVIPANEERLLEALLYEYSEDWTNTQDYFTSMRKIVEAIVSECKMLKIIPQIKELNTVSYFLDKGEHKNYELIGSDPIIPKPLAQGLKYFLNITQDASHEGVNLNYAVDKYVRETKNINLFRSILFIAMDLCLWFESVKQESASPTYNKKWRVKEDDIEIAIQQYENRIYEPQYDEELNTWHCDKCAIGLGTWERGKQLTLYNVKRNDNPKTKDKYPFYSKFKIQKEEPQAFIEGTEGIDAPDGL